MNKFAIKLVKFMLYLFVFIIDEFILNRNIFLIKIVYIPVQPWRKIAYHAPTVFSSQHPI